MDEKISTLLSNTEDADLNEIIVDFKMKETALSASYAMAVAIGKKSILDFMS